MGNMYPYVKHTHMLLVFISIALFNLRFFLRMRQPEKPLCRMLNVLPHLNDTLLLCSGVLMMQMASWKLFGRHYWLDVKLVWVMAYIVVGAFCLRSVPRSAKWYALYALAMLCVLGVVYLAHWKPI